MRQIASRFRLVAQLANEQGVLIHSAWDEKKHLPVTVRQLAPEAAAQPEIAARFLRTARALAKWKHPHLLPVIEAGDAQDAPYLVTPRLAGGTVADRLSSTSSTSAVDVLAKWLASVASAVDFANSRGASLRFIPAEAVCFDGLGAAFLDCSFLAYGSARANIDKASLAPELLQPTPQQSNRTDQYALAAVVLKAIGGFSPREFLSDHRMQQKVAVPTGLASALRTALAPRPEDRFGSSIAFADEALRELSPATRATSTARMLCPVCSNTLKVPAVANTREGKCPKCRSAIRWNARQSAIWTATAQAATSQNTPADESSQADSDDEWEHYSAMISAAPVSRSKHPRDSTARRAGGTGIFWTAVPRLPPIGTAWYVIAAVLAVFFAATLLYPEAATLLKRVQTAVLPPPQAALPEVRQPAPPQPAPPPEPTSDLLTFLPKTNAFTLSKKALEELSVEPLAGSGNALPLVARSQVDGGVEMKMLFSWTNGDKNELTGWWLFASDALKDQMRSLPPWARAFTLNMRLVRVTTTEGGIIKMPSNCKCSYMLRFSEWRDIPKFGGWVDSPMESQVAAALTVGGNDKSPAPGFGITFKDVLEPTAGTAQLTYTGKVIVTLVLSPMREEAPK